jgi:hypothetical protein
MSSSLLHGDHVWVAFGMIRAKLWTRWYEYVRDNPQRAFKPHRVSDADVALEAWVLALNEPDFPGMVVIHPWRVSRDDPATPYLQPGPYLMAETVDGARALVPPSATLLEGVPLVDRYSEAWLL